MHSMPFHEMWHCKQVTDYEKKYGKITKKNDKEYLTALRTKCKAKFGKARINKYNVGNISEYAKKHII